MSTTVAAFAPGSAIAPGYRVIEHLSRGRALDVYDVWSDERECRCVAKGLRPDRVDDRSARRRLVREGQLLIKLSHPHIVRGYELLATESPLVIMETLSGETLSHLIEEGDRLLPVEVAQLGLQLCSAIQYLHRHRILHLDLKPSNIVAEVRRAKIIDLSLARRPGRARGGSGTWCYMAPEQVRGGELGSGSDVWGIGVVLWEAAAGLPAFGGDEDEALLPSSSEEEDLAEELHPQLRRPADPIRRHRRLPAPLARAIDAALAPEPLDRPTISALAALLEELPGVVSPRSPRPD